MSINLPEFRGGLSAARVDQSLRQALEALDAARQNALLWFHEVLARRLYQDLGYASMEQYARESLGFSRNRTWQFLKLARDLDRLPPLREAVTNGTLEWTKAQQVGRVATPDTAQAWVSRARRSSRRELAREIKAARRDGRARAAGQAELNLAAPARPAPVPRVSITLSFDSIDAARLEAMIEAAKKSGALPANATREEAMLAALAALTSAADQPALRRRNSPAPYRVVLYRCRDCDATEVNTASGRRPVPHGAADAAIENAVVHDSGRNRHAIAPATREKVLARDGHRCRTPGCRAARFLELHHIVPRARGGSNRPANLITLCSRCHRFLHMSPRAGTRLIRLVDEHPGSPLNESLPGGLP